MSDVLNGLFYNPDPRLLLDRSLDHVTNLRLLGEATGPQQLLEWLQEAQAPLVLMNLDGAEALQTLGEVAATAPDCGIIGLSARAEPAMMIKAMRAGCSQFVAWPIDPADLQAAVEQVRVRQAPAIRGSKRICVVGASGGAGTTTVACNLASELAQLIGRPCGLVDLNLELGDIASLFDSQPTYTVGDVCRDGVEMTTGVLEEAFHPLPSKVSVLARPHQLQDIYEVTPEGISNMLAEARHLFPFVIVDLPRSFSFLSAAALGESDRVLIVTQLTVASIRNATRIHDGLVHLGGPARGISIVVNRGRSSLSRISIEDVEAHFGKPVFAVIPNDYRRVQASLDMGFRALAEDRSNPVRLAIRDMARKLASDLLEDPDADAAAESKGFLNRIWTRRKPPEGAAAASGA